VQNVSARDQLRATVTGNGNAPRTYSVSIDANRKLTLPPTPALDDRAGQCAWLTSVFSLDGAHPITSGARQGLRGAAGHVVLHRAGAPPLRFEPASRINQPPRLIEDLTWQMLQSDGVVHALKAEHCRQIAHVIRMLADAGQAISDEDEAAAIVGAFTATAIPVKGHTTYGTSAQRYKAAEALGCDFDDQTGRPIGAPRYLIDSQTGELVIGVGELAVAARAHIGSSLARGWLDGRMDSLGWRRVRLDGHAQPGRAGRHGPHARKDAYRGHLPTADDDQAVTT
jgi:hypothetical protein